MNLVAKVAYSLHVSKGQFENLVDLDVATAFDIRESGNTVIVSIDPVFPRLVIPTKNVEQEGDAAYFSDINDWCRELDSRWALLALDTYTEA